MRGQGSLLNVVKRGAKQASPQDEFEENYDKSAHTFSAESPDRSGDYSYKAILSRSDYDYTEIDYIFESVDDVEKWIAKEKENNPNALYDGHIERKPAYKAGTFPQRKTVYRETFIGKNGFNKEHRNSSERELCEHDISDQVLREDYIVERISDNSVTVTSLNKEMALNIIEVEIEDIRHLVEVEKENERLRQLEDARQARIRKQELEEQQEKKRQKRRERLAKQGLPEDHQGPTPNSPGRTAAGQPLFFAVEGKEHPVDIINVAGQVIDHADNFQMGQNKVEKLNETRSN